MVAGGSVLVGRCCHPGDRVVDDKELTSESAATTVRLTPEERDMLRAALEAERRRAQIAKERHEIWLQVRHELVQWGTRSAVMTLLAVIGWAGKVLWDAIQR